MTYEYAAEEIRSFSPRCDDEPAPLAATIPQTTIPPGGLAPWRQRKVEQVLGHRLGDPIRIDELAEAVRLSTSHFCRAFKASFGEAPHTHIMRRRVALAQRMMRTTHEPLSQIALACGLSDQAHLSKLFHRSVGQPPSVWRRLNAAA